MTRYDDAIEDSFYAHAMKTELEKRGYRVKNTSIGWWVDGAHGYLVSGYWPTKEKAILEAANVIQAAIAEHRKPAWLIEAGLLRVASRCRVV